MAEFGHYVACLRQRPMRARAGWLKFGEPGMSVAGCTPEHCGTEAWDAGAVSLVLWHGTVPSRTAAVA